MLGRASNMGPGDPSRKLLTMRRKLMLNMKQFVTLQERQSGSSQFESDLLHFESIRDAYDKFRDGLNDVNDSVLLKELSENVADHQSCCSGKSGARHLHPTHHASKGQASGADCQQPWDRQCWCCGHPHPGSDQHSTIDIARSLHS